MKFDFAFIKNGNHLIKAEMKASEGLRWATTSEQVYNYAKANLKKGEEVDITFTEKDGKYHIDRITKLATSNVEKKVESTVSERSHNISTQDLIVRQSVMSSACKAISVMTGQINDVETLGNMIEALYNKLHKIVNE